MRAEIRQLWSALLDLGFRLLYQELAWTYDTVSWLVSFGAWRAWQRSALPYIRGPRVLEIGHGPGHMLLALQQAGYQVTGLDRSRQMGRISRKRLLRHGLPTPLLRASAQQLPFAARSFDAVLATFPTEYLVAEGTLSEIYRVLDEHGRLVVIPGARFTGRSLPERFLESLYAITGQRPSTQTRGDPPLPEQTSSFAAHTQRFFALAGFSVAVETRTLHRSEVTIIIAEKPPPHPNQAGDPFPLQ